MGTPEGATVKYSITQVSQKTGLSPHTLRFYEKEGLLSIKKNASGNREYSDEDICWLSMIECLKTIRMPIKEIRQYIEWFHAGDSTIGFRRELFRKRKEILEEEVLQLKMILGKLEYKFRLYDEALRLGNLESAAILPKLKRMKRRLFGDPEFFPKKNKANEA